MLESRIASTSLVLVNDRGGRESPSEHTYFVERSRQVMDNESVDLLYFKALGSQHLVAASMVRKGQSFTGAQAEIALSKLLLHSKVATDANAQSQVKSLSGQVSKMRVMLMVAAQGVPIDMTSVNVQDVFPVS